MSNRSIVLDDSRELKLYDHSVVLRLARYLRGHERRIGLAMAAILAYTGTVAGLPWIIKWVVDAHVPAGDKSAIDLAAVAFLAVATTQLAASYLHSGSSHSWPRASSTTSVPSSSDTSTGSRCPSSTKRGRQNHVAGAERHPGDRGVRRHSRLRAGRPLQRVAVVAAMLLMSPLLAVVTMTVVPILVAVITVWQRIAREPRMRTRTMEAAINSHLQETISGIRVVQSMNVSSPIRGGSRTWRTRLWPRC